MNLTFRTISSISPTMSKLKGIPVEFLRRSARMHSEVSSRKDKKRTIITSDTEQGSKPKVEIEPPVAIKHVVPIKREPDLTPPIIISCDTEAIKRIHLPEPDGFIRVHEEELDLERTLLGGQSFRWTKEVLDDGKTPVFTGIILNHALKLWRISQDEIAFKVLNREASVSSAVFLLHDYFRLNYNLRDLYKTWGEKDENFKCARYVEI